MALRVLNGLDLGCAGLNHINTKTILKSFSSEPLCSQMLEIWYVVLPSDQ